MPAVRHETVNIFEGPLLTVGGKADKKKGDPFS